MNLQYLFSIALLVFGFGFVIFWHELGHFLAAKWVGIKVEQFAVGFGHAILAWRKGIGLRVGTTTREYERRLKEWIETHEDHLERHGDNQPTAAQLQRAGEALGLGETEYRLNWIPLGGYVKMLGQDDLNPNAQSDDPRAFNRKSIGARMIVVSAGVVMNVILAAIGFMAVFLMGFNVPPAWVGGVQPGSPAQLAGLQTGDELLSYDGKRLWDFHKLQLNVALSADGEKVPLRVRRTENGQAKELELTIAPRREGGQPRGFVVVGIMQPRALEGVSEKEKLVDDLNKLHEIAPPDALKVLPGDVITAVNGKSVNRDGRVDPTDFMIFDEALQSGFGKPVQLTVRRKGGATENIEVQPQFAPPFGSDGFNLLGMVPRASVRAVMGDSPARGKLMPGDVVTSLVINDDDTPNPSPMILRERLNAAGQNGKSVTLHVLRNGVPGQFADLTPTVNVERDKKGLGIMPGYDAAHAVVADVASGTPAAQAGISPGSTVTAVNGAAVQSWYDVHRVLSGAKAGDTVTVAYTTRGGEQKTASIPLNETQAVQLAGVRYVHELELGEPRVPRETDNPLVAAGWGISETRDFILQFYLTLRRMADGTVSPTNLMGPIGIFSAGTKFAYKGHDWLIWFLAMISANLAVVNFLPIPIVDGGLFTFLLLEKIKGRPLSPRTHAIAQGVGICLLLGIFLFVTYHDIARLPFMR